MTEKIIDAEVVESGVESGVENKEEGVKEAPTLPIRQIIIETDGNDIKLVKTEVSGKIELTAILQTIISHINSK